MCVVMEQFSSIGLEHAPGKTGTLNEDHCRSEASSVKHV